MMKAFVLLGMCALSSGCGSSSSPTAAQRACELLSTRTDSRLEGHRADFRGVVMPLDLPADPRDARVQALADLVSTTSLLWQVAPFCFRRESAIACAPVAAHEVDQDVRRSLTRTEEYAQALHGSGPCARDPSDRSASSTGRVCVYIRGLLESDVRIADRNIDQVRAAWSSPTGSGHSFGPFTIRFMSEWRAEIDYGLALAPLCAKRPLSPSCASLRQGLASASPDELLTRLRILAQAYDGTACP